MSLKATMIHTVTRYDRRRVNRRDYNPYALAQYLARVDSIIAEHESGKPLRDAIMVGFNDRLRDTILRACNLPLA